MSAGSLLYSSRDSAQHVTAEELWNDALKTQVDAFDAALTARLDDAKKKKLDCPFDGRLGGLDDIDVRDAPVDSAHGVGKTTCRPAYGDYSRTSQLAPRAFSEATEVDGVDRTPKLRSRMEDWADGKPDLIGRSRRAESRPNDGKRDGTGKSQPMCDSGEYLVEMQDGQRTHSSRIKSPRTFGPNAMPGTRLRACGRHPGKMT